MIEWIRVLVSKIFINHIRRALESSPEVLLMLHEAVLRAQRDGGQPALFAQVQQRLV